MSLLDMGLATKGADFFARARILQRHAYAFVKHLNGRKLANFAKAELARMSGAQSLESYPYILKIETNNICNLRCEFCYDGRRAAGEGERPYGRMTFEQFKKIIDETGDYLFKINLYGFGEPFLFPETFEMISYATSKNIGVGVSSNLNIKDPALAQKILDSGLEVLIFSCHGASKESYAKFMVSGDYDLAMANVAAVAREKRKRGARTPLIDWQYCVTKFNQHETGAAQKIAAELGIDQIRFIRPFIPENAPDEWFSDMFPRNVPVPPDKNNRVCAWPYRSGYINYDGGIIPCCRETRQLSSDLGNVLTEDFRAVWNNERYRLARALVSDPLTAERRSGLICSDCPATQVRPGNSPVKTGE